jgi:hypothetical protein
VHPTLPVVQGLHRKLTMVQDSDVILDFIGTLVWLVVLMLSLLIVALQCRYLDGLYGNEPFDVINVLSASWD